MGGRHRPGAGAGVPGMSGSGLGAAGAIGAPAATAYGGVPPARIVLAGARASNLPPIRIGTMSKNIFPATE
jgi:hypothetical protein